MRKSIPVYRRDFAVLIIGSPFLNDSSISLLARLGRRGFSGRITYRQSTDSHQTIGKSPLTHQLPSFFGGKHLAFAMNPATTQSEGMSGEHHVSEYQTTVLHTIGSIGGNKHQHVSGCIVIRVESHSHHLGVHSGQTSQQVGTLHRHNERRLQAAGSGSIRAGFEHDRQFIVGDLNRFVAATATAGTDDFLNIHFFYVFYLPIQK